MKKLLSLVLALSMLIGATFALNSCSKDTPPEELTPERMVTLALEKTNALNSYAGKMDISMTLNMSGQTILIAMYANMKVQDAQNDNIKAQTDLTMSMMGSTMTATSYSDKDWVYSVSADGNYKQKIEEESDQLAQMDSIMQTLPSEVYEGVEAVKNEDGSSSVTVAIPDNVFNETYAELLETVKSSFSSQNADVTIANAVVTVKVKDGFVAKYDITFDMTVSVSGTTGVVDVVASVEFTQYEGVTVTLPTGCENFPER